MLTAFFLSLKSRVFGSGLSGIIILIPIVMILIIVIPNLSQISRKLGFDTVASVKEELIVSSNKTNAAVAANVTVNDTLKALVDAKNIGVAVSNNMTAKNDDNVKKTKTIISDRNKAVTDIQTKLLVDVDPVLKLAMQLSGESLERVRISQANITAIWTAYCLNKQTSICNESSN